jgi:hypothetical protein
MFSNIGHKKKKQLPREVLFYKFEAKLYRLHANIRPRWRGPIRVHERTFFIWPALPPGRLLPPHVPIAPTRTTSSAPAVAVREDGSK